jgi:hypothetical protein
MSAQKHAFMFFTKAPTPGLTKTRLTSAKGGVLTEEEATELYTAVMLDVAEIGHAALDQLNAAAGKKGDTYDFVVCSTPASDMERIRLIFEESFSWPIRYITDQGKTFNEHFDDGFKQLWKLGYHSAVSIGGDLPSMPVSHIVRAFQWLSYFDSAYETGGLVFCPCQACGVSLVGLTEKTPMDFDGVFYNPDGTPALDAITALSEARGIPTAGLDPVSDIDNAEDLAHALSLARSHAYVGRFQPEVMAPKRFLAWAEKTGITVNTPPNFDHDPREEIDA